MRRYVQGVALLAVCLVALTASCRRTQPSLVDRNQAPDTELWYAPPDSSEYEYIVHLYWRGIDNDGTTRRFIWAVEDTIAAFGLSWNPAERLEDYRQGRITTRTDSVFSFRAYRDVGGVGVRKNRQAFFVAAIDDNGVIDPFPAAVEFVATISSLPEIRFLNHIGGEARLYTNQTPPADTVGMYRPFAISYHGVTTNGQIRGYQYFPLSTTIIIPGSGIWSDDPADTLVNLANTTAHPLPAGTFRFAAKCIDDASAESQVDAGRFRFGVSQIVVNFDPDTRLFEAKNTYYKNRLPIVETVNFTDNVPDTVPFKSWLYFRYDAHDSRRWVDGPAPAGRWEYRDVVLCSTAGAAKKDECIDFQLKLIRDSDRVAGAYEDSGWLPRSGTHDSDKNSPTDSNTVNVGSLEYQFMVSGVDENGSRDGTPAILEVIGNFDPTIDTYSIQDHFGNVVDLEATNPTLTWNFYKGIGWPYDEASDTTLSDGRYFKRFGFSISATGHDHPKDPDGSAVRTWRYFTYTDYNSSTNSGTFWPLGRAGNAWFPGTADNQMTDNVEIMVKYEHPQGDDLFAQLPGFINQVLTIVLYGRDTQLLEPEFSQYVYWDLVPTDSLAGSGTSTRNLINAFPTEPLGRWTPEKISAFYLKMER